MNANKILKISFFVFVFSVVWAAFSVLVTKWRYPTQSYGKLVFEKAYEFGDKIDKIEILSNGNVITIIAKDGYWVVKEADGYFANIKYLNSLMMDFNKSTYYAKQKFSEENLKKYGLAQDATIIKVYDNAKLLDEIRVGKSAKNNIFHFMRPVNKDEIWLVDGTYGIPTKFNSWIIQPVMELPVKMIEKIETGDDKLVRFDEGLPFMHGTKMYETVNLLNYAQVILAENVLNAENFAKLDLPLKKELTFTTFQGLVVSYKLYSKNDEYWLNISLSTTALPKAVVNDYIKDNKIFFDGWYFKLPQDQGRGLLFTPLI